MPSCRRGWRAGVMGIMPGRGCVLCDGHRERGGRCHQPAGAGTTCTSAQRPKASARRTGPAPHPWAAGFGLCSTPEGIGSENSRGPPKAPRAARGAQRPKASARRTDLVFRERPGNRSVLNARRHRLGEQGRPDFVRVAKNRCSTPEGIGSENSISIRSLSTSDRRCSTPEGIGSENSFEEWEKHFVETMCSTPEGIGSENRTKQAEVNATAAGAQRPKASARRTGEQGVIGLTGRGSVLNARRHRLGEQKCPWKVGVDPHECSTPEGIGSENSSALAGVNSALS